MHMEWTGEDDEVLRRLSEDGLPTSAIARVLGRSKNSVCGRRGRLGLPKRPSPIKEWPTPPVLVLEGIAGLSRHQCRYPIGEGAAMRFCEEQAVEGRPYCLEHMRCTHLVPGHRAKGQLPASYWIKAKVLVR